MVTAFFLPCFLPPLLLLGIADADVDIDDDDDDNDNEAPRGEWRPSALSTWAKMRGQRRAATASMAPVTAKLSW